MFAVHDDIRIMLVEAPTYSGADPGAPPVPMGPSDDVAIGCSSLGQATVAWAGFGLSVSDATDTRVTLRADGLALSLAPDGPRRPTWRYGTTQFDTLMAILEAQGVSGRLSPDGAVITAPEGTALEILTSD